MDRMYDRIDRLCKMNGTNVTAMCRELGITRSVLSELKAGRTHQLSGEHLARIAKYFEISVDNLMGHSSDGRDEIPDELRLIARKISMLDENQREQICRLLDRTVESVLFLMKSARHEQAEQEPLSV